MKSILAKDLDFTRQVHHASKGHRGRYHMLAVPIATKEVSSISVHG
jgi:hypothetical protein